MDTNQNDWKKTKKGWPYKKDALEDQQYMKDRNKTFKENGNGWWWTQGYHSWKPYFEIKRSKKRGVKNNEQQN